MEKSIAITAIKSELLSIFKAHPEVGLVYLFGSRARGEANSMSDYDFAIYLNEKDNNRRGELKLILADELMSQIGNDKIDLLILNDVYMPELKYQIIQEGILLFEREPFRVLVEPNILTEYFDFHYLLKKYGLTKA